MGHATIKSFAVACVTLIATATVAIPTQGSAALPARWNTTQRGLILVPDEAHAITTDLAVKRLRSLSPIRYDLVDGVRDNRTDFKNYDITIILGVTGDNKELAQGWTDERPTNQDAWALKTISTDPLVIVATGNRPRAVLYAVWALADKLSMGDDISSLAMQEVPRVDKRYAAVCGVAWAFAGDPPVFSPAAADMNNRHTMYMSTIEELPRYGINGVYLSPGMWRTAVGPGMVPPPVSISDNGKVSVNDTTVAAWRTMIGVMKAYDMDVVMTIEPVMPTSFNMKKVEQDYFKDGKRPAGFLEAMETINRDYIEKMIEVLPDIDGYVLHAGVEGARFSGPNIRGTRMFLSGQNLGASVEAMSAYLKVADDLALKYKKSLAFWTHQFGINTEGIYAMRRMLFNFPRITIIEESFWPNSFWINGDRLPPMAYLPADLRAEVDKHGNKLGFFECTDAEVNGGGALPTAIGETFAYAMREAVKRNTGMAVFRLNLHDRTPYGTLFSVSGIQLEQANNQLWQNPRPESEVWDTWIRRMYGNAAAPLISKALSNDIKIIRALTDINGLYLLSRVSAKGWVPQNGKIKRFARPKVSAKTGATPTPVKAGAVVESADQQNAQLGSGGPIFAEYSRQNRAAAEMVQSSLALIDQARPNLARADYAYLHEIYKCAGIILDVVLKLSEASYATNLMKDNFDNIPDPKGYFEKTIKALEESAASDDVKWISTERGYVYGDIDKDMLIVAAAYRKFIEN